MSAKRKAPRNTADNWDVKGRDVPGRRMVRSLMKGLTGADEETRVKVKKARRKALNRLRAVARNVEDAADRTAIWQLVGQIGLAGYPSWDEVVKAVTETDFLALARRGELHVETDARRERDAENSERRTVRQSVDDYLTWQEEVEFSPDTCSTAQSVLRRALTVLDREKARYADRRLASLVRRDAREILKGLDLSERTGERIDKETRAKNAKVLHAWLNFELEREKERAEEEGRQPLFSLNLFDEEGSRYSAPRKDPRATVQDRKTRRFAPDEMDALMRHANMEWRFILTIVRCLGLRPGEFIHLRWLDDVRPLEDGRGYEVVIEGNRGPDPRCKCRQCRAKRGWAPKNGPRRYILDRRNSRLGWITPACEALDAWLAVRKPARGDFLFPDPDNWGRAWSDAKLNKALHELAAEAGVPTGMKVRGKRTFHSLRHTCGCELLERGVTHPHAAYWIGDTLPEFVRTYGKPTDEAMAKAIFGE